MRISQLLSQQFMPHAVKRGEAHLLEPKSKGFHSKAKRTFNPACCLESGSMRKDIHPSHSL